MQRPIAIGFSNRKPNDLYVLKDDEDTDEFDISSSPDPKERENSSIKVVLHTCVVMYFLNVDHCFYRHFCQNLKSNL